MRHITYSGVAYPAINWLVNVMSRLVCGKVNVIHSTAYTEGNLAAGGNDLTNTNTVNISVNQGSTVLINVTGSGQTFQNGQVFLNGVDASQVIYNFSDATSLTLAGSKNPFGTVLAPFANVSGGFGTLDGQLIAQSFNGNIEFHNVLFTGELPASVPVPAAVWLFASALGLMRGVARKRSA